ncbi:hypothetical protein Vadar_008122 [Vaccinium darrowii]|uniref:Uncharacterized protein n=1 Tax=Vaccinium darrowii TaxID=229202 RepID=A0ACB7WYR8_9ERIC|nr:hypothetical protein Vadar_008122 [Vaccinium darrowii]
MPCLCRASADPARLTPLPLWSRSSSWPKPSWPGTYRNSGSFDDHGYHNNGHRNHFFGANTFSSPQIRCQICDGMNNNTCTCNQQYNHIAPPSAYFASYNAPSQTSDQFSETSVTHPVTPDSANFFNHEDYRGNDHLHVGNGNELTISNTGSTTLHSSSSSFKLFNICMFLQSPSPYFLLMINSPKTPVFFCILCITFSYQRSGHQQNFASRGD